MKLKFLLRLCAATLIVTPLNLPLPVCADPVEFSDKLVIVPRGSGFTAGTQTADLNYDGYLDVLCSQRPGSVVWYEHFGDGVFGPEQEILAPVWILDLLRWGDVTGDGLNDLIYVDKTSNELRMMEAVDNTGSFGIEQIIATNTWDHAFDIGDVDGDGDIDLIVGGTSGINHERNFQWFRNTNGNGNFELSGDFSTTQTGFPIMEELKCRDIDTDGDGDFVLLLSSTPLFWYEYISGLGVFGDEQQIIPSQESAADVFFADVDGDQDDDLVVTHPGIESIFWYENEDGQGTFGEGILISSGVPDVSLTECADLDGDGDYDVISCYSSPEYEKLVWFENLDGVGGFGPLIEIATSTWVFNSIEPVDLDNDIDIDILCATRELFWFRNETNDPHVLLELTGVTTEIPQNGGPLVYDAHLQYNLPDPIPQASYWAKVVLPSGETTGPILRQRFSVWPGMDITRTFTHDVPGSASSGTYTYIGMAGFYPNALLTDTFSFTKAGTAFGEGFDPSLWPTTGGFGSLAADAVTATLPNEFRFEPVYPNPFNASATVRVNLPTASSLTVTVYNLLGERVAELASGRYSAGDHSFTFDGSDLASGIYIVQARVPGRELETRKVVLLK